MSFLACGLESVNSHGPCWMPWVSLEPPPVKMSSALRVDRVGHETGGDGRGAAVAEVAKTLLQSSLVDGGGR